MASYKEASGHFATTVRQATGSNAVASVTVTGIAGLQFVVTGYSISASASISAAVEATIKDGSGNYLEGMQIPAAAFAPIVVNFGTHPIRVAVSTDVVLNLPALGAGILGEVVLKGFYSAA